MAGLGDGKLNIRWFLRKLKVKIRDADTPASKTWLKETLPNILSHYSESDLFNADKTGLYYRLHPDRPHVLKGENLAGGKKSKARVTILVCANMNGTEKLPLLMIRKSKKPR